MKGFQSLFDSRFTAQRESLKKTFETDFEKAFKAKYHINEDGKQVEDGKLPPSDEAAALFAKLLDEKLKPLSDKITAEEARRAAETRTAQIIEKAKANGISEDLAKMLSVPSDVTDLDSFFKDKAQQLTNLGFQPTVPPASSDTKSEGKTFAEQIRAGAPKPEK